MSVLMRWSWPGNIRELVSVLEQAACRRPGGDIASHDLCLEHRTHYGRRPLSPLEQAEADTILASLRRASGNKTHAATELGISRTTLYRRMRELDIA
jgi:transcriptional regulator of acetoin/glycerol metabolism